MEMNTIDMSERYFFMVVNPSVQINRWVVNMHPHVIGDSVVTEVHAWMEMKTVDTKVIVDSVVMKLRWK